MVRVGSFVIEIRWKLGGRNLKEIRVKSDSSRSLRLKYKIGIRGVMNVE